MSWTGEIGGQIRGLTQEEIEAYYRGKPPRPNGKGEVRYPCPIHGGDNPTSFRLNVQTGHFRCFRCGSYGYLKPFEEKWKKEQRKQQVHKKKKMGRKVKTSRPPLAQSHYTKPAPSKQEISTDLSQQQQTFQDALKPESIGHRYLRWRKIPLEIAFRYGVGYAPQEEWPHLNSKGKPVRQWIYGRITIPHTDPSGHIINFYGRAIGDNRVPRSQRHDHLPGIRGCFNGPALKEETCLITEGAFDALALIAAGYPNACAIFGANGLRWEWVQSKRIVFCLDQDSTGDQAWKDLAQQARLLGKKVFWLEPEAYQGKKDLNETWIQTGRIDIGSLETPPKSAVEWDDEEAELMIQSSLDWFEAEYGDAVAWSRRHEPELVDVVDTIAERINVAYRTKDRDGLSRWIREWDQAYQTVKRVYEEISVKGPSK